jgi:uncharacterized FlgJ-related protein
LFPKDFLWVAETKPRYEDFFMFKSALNTLPHASLAHQSQRAGCARMNLEQRAQGSARSTFALGVLAALLLPSTPTAFARTAADAEHTGAKLGEVVPLHIHRQVRDALPAELRHREGLSTEERQQRFVDTLLPAILAENERVLRERRTVAALLKRAQPKSSLRTQEVEWLQQLAEDYGIQGNPLSDSKAKRELLMRVDVIPPSLALAQAAIETGWGSSGSAQRDRNLFGMVGGKSRHGRHSSRNSYQHFAHLADSVQRYVHNLNSHPAYGSLRTLRARARANGRELSGSALTPGLVGYSRLGNAYVRLIGAAIRNNSLSRYDIAQLEPNLKSAPEIASESPGVFGITAHIELEGSTLN